jgi:3-phenylpropionate/cinnamic acid dioxygenase small subunit
MNDRALPLLARTDAEDFLAHEARLLDERRLVEWNALFTDDGLYWIPLDENASHATQASIVHDGPLRREERVHHLLNDWYPAQSPPSRTLHQITNVAVEADGAEWIVRSNQVIWEMRTGDFTQVGVGDLRPIVAFVDHRLRRVEGGLRIARKRILLLNRDGWLGNLTFLF